MAEATASVEKEGRGAPADDAASSRLDLSGAQCGINSEKRGEGEKGEKTKDIEMISSEDEEGNNEARLEMPRPPEGYAKAGWWRMPAWRDFKGHTEQMLERQAPSQLYWKPKIFLDGRQFELPVKMPLPDPVRWTQFPCQEEIEELLWHFKTSKQMQALLASWLKQRDPTFENQQQQLPGQGVTAAGAPTQASNTDSASLQNDEHLQGSAAQQSTMPGQ